VSLISASIEASVLCLLIIKPNTLFALCWKGGVLVRFFQLPFLDLTMLWPSGIRNEVTLPQSLVS
jgi:hypothetical protein